MMAWKYFFHTVRCIITADVIPSIFNKYKIFRNPYLLSAFFLLFAGNAQLYGITDIHHSDTSSFTSCVEDDYFLSGYQDTTFVEIKDSVVSSSDSTVISFLKNVGISVSSDNSLTLLKDAPKKFEHLFDDIKNAKHHIHLEYFNFRNDSIGNALFDLLAIKAKEGVQVRALVDAFGNSSNNLPFKKSHLKKIRNTGVEIEVFKRFSFPYVDYPLCRDHRKIVVIDGIIGYTGGINVADYYIHGNKKIGDWHDTHLKIRGAAVASLQKLFLSIWNPTAHQEVGGSEYFPYIEPLPKEQEKLVAIVDRTPQKNPALMRHAYSQSIDAAQSKIQIVNPYFLPTSSIKKALKRALIRGVEVEILFSPKADVIFTPEGSVYAAQRLMKQGAKVYLYNGGFHHSKIMMVDDLFCTIGTTNLDARSLRYDYEVNAFLFDKEITHELNEYFNSDKEECNLLTPELWRERPLWTRFVGWLANMLTPFL